jgi:uncharacterized protein DUF3237
MQPHRREFLDKSVLYLFSADIELSMGVEQLGLTPEGLRATVSCVGSTSRVYNVLRHRSLGMADLPAITGRLRAGEDRALLREDDVAVADVRALIETDDGAVIETTYKGVVALGMGTFRMLAGGRDQLGTPERPLEVPIVITPRYATLHPRYAWLNEMQCVGFGRVKAIDGAFRQVSYDIYAMM